MAGCSASASRRGSWWHEGEGKVVVVGVEGEVVGEGRGGGQAAGAQDEASHRQPHFHLLQSKHRHMPLHVACGDHLALHVFKQRDKKKGFAWCSSSNRASCSAMMNMYFCL